MSDEPFLSRWSRLKKAERRGEGEGEPVPVVPAQPPAAEARPAGAVPVPEPLPPVESLTTESDFTPFMKSEVDPLLRRQALKTLFQDPRFNVMDGLDVYIADFAKPDPLPEGWLEKMNQVVRLGEYREPEPEKEAPQEGALPGDEGVVVATEAAEEPLPTKELEQGGEDEPSVPPGDKSLPPPMGESRSRE